MILVHGHPPRALRAACSLFSCVARVTNVAAACLRADARAVSRYRLLQASLLFAKSAQASETRTTSTDRRARSSARATTCAAQPPACCRTRTLSFGVRGRWWLPSASRAWRASSRCARDAGVGYASARRGCGRRERARDAASRPRLAWERWQSRTAAPRLRRVSGRAGPLARAYDVWPSLARVGAARRAVLAAHELPECSFPV
jgi:hypothetical protein